MIIVLASLVFVLCLFVNFTMNWLYPFSMTLMAKASVTVATIWHKTVVNLFSFLHPSDGYRLFVLLIIFERTIFSVHFSRHFEAYDFVCLFCSSLLSIFWV